MTEAFDRGYERPGPPLTYDMVTATTTPQTTEMHAADAEDMPSLGLDIEAWAAAAAAEILGDDTGDSARDKAAAAELAAAVAVAEAVCRARVLADEAGEHDADDDARGLGDSAGGEDADTDTDEY